MKVRIVVRIPEWGRNGLPGDLALWLAEEPRFGEFRWRNFAVSVMLHSAALGGVPHALQHFSPVQQDILDHRVVYLQRLDLKTAGPLYWASTAKALELAREETAEPGSGRKASKSVAAASEAASGPLRVRGGDSGVPILPIRPERDALILPADVPSVAQEGLLMPLPVFAALMAQPPRMDRLPLKIYIFPGPQAPPPGELILELPPSIEFPPPNLLPPGIQWAGVLAPLGTAAEFRPLGPSAAEPSSNPILPSLNLLGLGRQSGIPSIFPITSVGNAAGTGAASWGGESREFLGGSSAAAVWESDVPPQPPSSGQAASVLGRLFGLPVQDVMEWAAQPALQKRNPDNGAFDLVILQSSSYEADPERAALFSGQPIYTVYVDVGAGQEWSLKYCVPRDGEMGLLVHGSVVSLDAPAPVSAPYPLLMVTPAVTRAPRRHFILVSGVVDKSGHFQNLQILGDAELALSQALVPDLKKWEFRPATQGGKPVLVEVLLAIPPTA